MTHFNSLCNRTQSTDYNNSISCKYKTFAFSEHILGRVMVRVLSVLTPWDKLHPWSIERNLRRNEENDTH